MSASKLENTIAADSDKFFLGGLAQMPQLNIKMLTRANEIMTEAAKAIWSSEVELLRLEAEEGAKLLPFAGRVGDPADAYTQWHESSEKILSQMRGMSDQMRKCGWELFQLYAENAKPNGKAVATD